MQYFQTFVQLIWCMDFKHLEVGPHLIDLSACTGEKRFTRNVPTFIAWSVAVILHYYSVVLAFIQE